MQLTVLALDYDGTIAHDDRIDDEMREAIREVRRRGIVTILVTGRILRDLRRQLGGLRLFDAVVAENGAVLAYPASDRSTLLASPPSAPLLEQLVRRGIGFAVGECIVEADAADANRILTVVRELELPLVLLFNRGRLMVLPQAISKATGLREMLTTLRLSAHNAMAIGDAENDHEMLSACERGVAVAWGSDALKAMADEVLDGDGPTAVARYIRDVARLRRLRANRVARRQLLLGSRDDGSLLFLAMGGRNVLVTGDSHSGKSWIAGLMCEQHILQHYSVFIIDPEGDYAQLEALPGVIVVGDEGHPPRLADIARFLHHHDVSIVADLSMLAPNAKRHHVASLLSLLLQHRRRTGLPHRIVVDEAHYFIDQPDVLQMLDLAGGGYTFVTFRSSKLRDEVVAATEAVIVTRATDHEEVAALLDRAHVAHDRPWATQLLNNLALDEAVLMPPADEAAGRLCKFRSASRLTTQVRHRHKYFDVPVSRQNEFVFTRHGIDTGRRARSLKQLVEAIAALPDDVLDGHFQRHDVSRWIDDVFGDYVLADSIRELETRCASGHESDVRGAIAERVQERYATSDESAHQGLISCREPPAREPDGSH